jgi:hypothetical protein
MSSSETELAPAAARTIDVRDGSLVVALTDGRSLSVPLEWYPRLAEATPQELMDWQIVGRGEGIHWPRLDEDISVVALLTGQRSREGPDSLRRWRDGRKAAG